MALKKLFAYHRSKKYTHPESVIIILYLIDLDKKIDFVILLALRPKNYENLLQKDSNTFALQFFTPRQWKTKKVGDMVE